MNFSMNVAVLVSAAWLYWSGIPAGVADALGAVLTASLRSAIGET